MPFAPDIVVTTQDTPRLLLIVEAKLASRIRSQDESQLKSYMLQMRCPIGLLVTPDEIVVYRDTYTAHSEESVRRVGTFPSPKSWEVFKAPHHGTPGSNTDLEARFEQRVRSWLEHLRSSPAEDAGDVPEEAREALVDYVLPAVSQGTVRAGGPRELRVPSH